MSQHTVVVPPVGIDDEGLYAEQIVIDEGGIDLKIDGETYISAAFEGLDLFQIAYEVLPESYTVFPIEDTEIYEESIELAAISEEITDVDLELAARVFLTALARRKGYEKR